MKRLIKNGVSCRLKVKEFLDFARSLLVPRISKQIVWKGQIARHAWMCLLWFSSVGDFHREILQLSEARIINAHLFVGSVFFLPKKLKLWSFVFRSWSFPSFSVYSWPIPSLPGDCCRPGIVLRESVPDEK